MEELDLYSKMNAIYDAPLLSSALEMNADYAQLISEHKTWLRSIRHERPSTLHHFNVGVYIRYFNQTRYEDYLNYHKKQFKDTVGLCPNGHWWTFILTTDLRLQAWKNLLDGSGCWKIAWLEMWI